MATQDEVIRRIAARHGVTLAWAAELLRKDPELAETVADDPNPPELVTERDPGPVS